MANNYISEGHVVTLKAPYAVSSGGGVKVGALIGIALVDLAEAESGSVALRGKWSVAKVSAQEWTQGAKVYWDDSAKNFTTTSSGNTLVGAAAEYAANPSSVGCVLLNGVVV